MRQTKLPSIWFNPDSEASSDSDEVVVPRRRLGKEETLCWTRVVSAEDMDPKHVKIYNGKPDLDHSRALAAIR